MPNVPDYSSFVGMKKMVVAQTGNSAIVARKGRAVSSYTNYFPLYRGVGFVANSLISNKFVNLPVCPVPPENRIWTYGSLQTAGGAGTFIYALATSSDGGVTIMGSNYGIYVNRDNGATGFTFISDGTSNFPPQVPYGPVGISGDGNIMVAGAGNNLWISRNRGVTWSTIGFGAAGSATISRNGNMIIYNTGGALYISRDSGATFTTHTTASMGVPANSKNLACSCDGRVIYAATNQSYLTVSVDYGYTWKAYDGSSAAKRAIGDGTSNYYSIACNDDGTRAITVSYSGLCYLITDYGNSWSTIPFGAAPWGSCSMSGGGRYACISYDNGSNMSAIYVSQDYGVTWNALSINVAVTAGRFTRDGRRLYCFGGFGGGANQRWYQGA